MPLLIHTNSYQATSLRAVVLFASSLKCTVEYAVIDCWRTWDFGIYGNVKQQRLRWAYANAQTYQSFGPLYSILCKTVTLKKTKIGFQDQLSLNAGQKYCRMLQREHSAILWTFINLPFVIKTFVLSILEWPFYTGFTLYTKYR